MKFSILLIFGIFSCAYGSPISTEVSENEGKVYSCQIKQEQCQFATVAPVYYTTCKNDDTICSGGGGESDPCEGDSPDSEEMKFCTAKMAEISDLTDAQKPWVLCSEECFDGSTPKNYTATTGCAAEVRQCKFPFIFNDKEYTDCTDDLLFVSDDKEHSEERTKESFKWCATSTNKDGSMKKGKWGRCDEATCKWENQASPTPNSHHLNCTCPLIEEQVLNATKNLLADELVEVTLQFDSKVVTAENRLTAEIEGLMDWLTMLEVSISSKDTKIGQLKQRFEWSIAAKDNEISQLKQRFGGLERSIVSKDTEISQLKQQCKGFEGSIAAKDTKIDQLEQRFGRLERSIVLKDTEIGRLKQLFEGLEESIALKDTEIGQLKQRFGGLERSIASKDSEIGQLKQRFGGLERSIASKDSEIVQLKQRLNDLDIKVIFSAVKTSGCNFKGTITYDNLVVNLGEGFDMGSGTFVVPTSGLYRLSFSAQSGYEKYDYTSVSVKKNGETVFSIWDSNAADDVNNLSYTWIMNLTMNDRVYLNSDNHLYASSDTPVTFTGELIHI